MVKFKKTRKNFDEYITGWMGSVPSILIHSFLFLAFLSSPFLGFDLQSSLLVLTTIVSLEAIYLSLFIQMSINRQTIAIDEVSEDIEEIQEDVEDIQEDVEDIQEDVEEVSKDVEEISESVDEIEKDVDEIHEDMEEEETEEQKEDQRKIDQKARLEKIENTLEVLLKEIHNLRK